MSELVEVAQLAVPLALFLIDEVIRILQHENQRPPRVKSDVKNAERILRRLEAYLADSSNFDEATHRPQESQARVRDIEDVAYDIEIALEKFMLQVPHHIHSNLCSKVMHEIVHYLPNRKAEEELSTEIKDVLNLTWIRELNSLHLPPSHPTPTAADSTHHDHVPEEEEIVGFEKHEEKLLAQLLKSSPPPPESRVLTISIVGPPGSGKTTLAKKVFNKRRVQGLFDCQAWVYLPRAFVLHDVEDVLLKILSQVEEKLQRKEPVTDPKAKLKLLLKDKRFLVVLDNVCCSRADLEHVVGALVQPGLHDSRIIITSTRSDVAKSLSSEQYVHDLSPGLPREKAKYLFCKKVFKTDQGTCPADLDDWAEKILKWCEGMPFAISAVGSHLSTKLKTTVEWRDFHNSLASEIRPDSNLSVISRILQPSYKDLPAPLKRCFLYLCIFPEGHSIERQKLIRLWMAEGFVENRTGKTAEKVAEGYLNELVARNLLQTVAREIDGRQVRRCRVSSHVRDFIISKANNFITILNQTDCGGTSAISREKIRRLSIHNGDIKKLLEPGYELDSNRTLFLFHHQQSARPVLDKVVERFRHLSVLDLQGVHLEDFPKSVLDLTLLRYLSLRETNIKTVPKSIKKLALLQTLDLKQTRVTVLPKEIYKLPRMRHLLVYRYDVKNYVKFGAAQGVEVTQSMLPVPNIGDLSSLQKLSLVKVKNNKKLITALGKLSGLRKLGLTDLETQDGRDLCLAIQNMKNLSTLDVRSTGVDNHLDLDHMQSDESPVYLERLYLKGRLVKLPRWIPKQHSLAKIGLKWSKLNANPLEFLQDLPNLMQLQLVGYYTGEALEFKTETFKKLKILHIEEFEGLNTMVIQSGAMPMLEKLTMCKCRNLNLLPVFQTNDLKSLKELLLYDMNKEFIDKLQNDCEDRLGYKHVRVIHSISLDNGYFSGFKNISPSKWH